MAPAIDVAIADPTHRDDAFEPRLDDVANGERLHRHRSARGGDPGAGAETWRVRRGQQASNAAVVADMEESPGANTGEIQRVRMTIAADERQHAGRGIE